MPYVFVNEVVGRSEHAMIALGTHSAQDATMLHLFGTDEQKEQWLRPLVAGEIYPSIGMTEPEVAGSDPTGVRATAVLDGDEWVVNAHKWFTTGASMAAFTTVFAVTEPDAPAARARVDDHRADRLARATRSCARSRRWATPRARTARSG